MKKLRADFYYALRCSVVEFKKWIMDYRMLVFLVLLIFTYSYVSVPLLANADKYGERINILEPYAALMNSGTVLLILPLTFLVLISDFPRIDTNTVFYISRINRKAWLSSQVIKLFMMVVGFEIIIFLGTVIPLIGRAEIGTVWSDVATKYVSRFPEEAYSFAVSLTPSNMYHNMSLIETTLKSTIYLGMYLFLLGGVLLLCSLLRFKAVGFFLDGAFVSIGTVLCSFSIKAMWMMPCAHSIVWLHYDAYKRKPVMNELVSVLYFGGIIFALILSDFLLIKRFNYDNVNEIEI